MMMYCLWLYVYRGRKGDHSCLLLPRMCKWISWLSVHLFEPFWGGVSCSCRWEEGGKLQSQWGGLPSQWHLETRTLSRVRLWQRRHCLWWDTVRGPVKLWEGCHARGRVLPCVRQLRKCQQDDRWDRFTCIQKRDAHFVLDLHPL